MEPNACASEILISRLEAHGVHNARFIVTTDASIRTVCASADLQAASDALKAAQSAGVSDPYNAAQLANLKVVTVRVGAEPRSDLGCLLVFLRLQSFWVPISLLRQDEAPPLPETSSILATLGAYAVLTDITGGAAGPAPGAAGALDACELRTAAEGLASLRERRLAWQASASSALFFEQAFEKKAAAESNGRHLEAVPLSGALARILDAAKMKEQKAGE